MSATILEMDVLRDMKRPLYRLKIDPEKGKVVNKISLVKEPAIESDFIYFSKEVPTHVEMFANDERMELLGIALKANKPIYRRTKSGTEYDVLFTPEDIRYIAQTFFKEGYQNDSNVQHSAIPADSTIFQSFMVDSTLGLNAPSSIKDAEDGDWIVGVKVFSKDIWEQVKKGEIKGFSIEGMFDYFELFEKDGISDSSNDEGVESKTEKKSSFNKKNEIQMISFFKNMVSKKVVNLIEALNDMIYSYDEIKVSDKVVGAKVEIVDVNGELAPIEDGEYVMEDGLVITTKGGLIESIVDKDGNPLGEKSEVPATSEEQAEDTPVEDSKSDELKAEFESFKSDVETRLTKIEEALSLATQSNDEVKVEAQQLSKVMTELTEVLKKTPHEFSKANPSSFKQDKNEEKRKELEDKKISLAKILANRKKS